jgi:ABC-2 type transport system permease protein
MWSLYWRLVGARIRAQMQYKLSFWLELLGFALTTGLEFSVVAILFTRFPSLGGWHIAEIALLYGLTETSFSLTEMIGRGFDAPFEVMMQRGTFDTLLTRPLDGFFQVLASEFQLRRLGRTAQALTVLGFAFSQLPISWTPAKLLLIPLSVLSGTVIYLGLFIIGATICFWTIKAPEVINAFTFGGNTTTSYPLSIYNRLIRTIFLFIVPVAFVNYPTALLLLGRSDPYGLPAWAAWAAPLVALIFVSIACGFWRIGVSKYTSAGS